MSDRKAGYQWERLHFAAGLTAEAVLHVVRLLGSRPPTALWQARPALVLEVVGSSDGIRWQIGAAVSDLRELRPHLRSYLAGLRLEPMTDRQLPTINQAVELHLSDARLPLRSDTAPSVSTAILTALSAVEHGEVLVLSWLIGPGIRRSARPLAGGAGSRHQPTTSDLAARRAKYSEPLLAAVGRIGVQAVHPARQRALIGGVLDALRLTRSPGVGLMVRSFSNRAAIRRLTRMTTPLVHWPCVLNAAELVGLLGWPVGNPLLPGVAYRGGRQLPPARGTTMPAVGTATAPGRCRVVGAATFPGQEGLLTLDERAALQHLHVIGPTGSGKSVLLARLIEADLVAGRSVVVIEPKSDLIASVVDRMPEERIDDVVLLDPTDRSHAVGLNLMAGPDPELVADQLLHVIRQLNRDSWGPRTAQLLHVALTTLARSGTASLAELPLLLTSPAYRARLLASVHPTTGQPVNDPLGTAGVWAWFDSLSAAERSTIIGPSLNKLAPFLNRRAIRAVVGQVEPTFQLADVFRRRRVLLVNLAKGTIGPEAARLLGALVFSALWQTALGRSALPPEQRSPVLVYVDEFQDYVRGLPLDFGEVLAQARGLHVGLTLAHQGLHQLDTDTKSSVLSNARSRIAFGCSSSEAKTLAASLGNGLTADDLQALGVYEAYASLVLHGHPTSPASMRTLPPPPVVCGRAEAVRARSRTQWASPISEVEAAILSRRQLSVPVSGLGGQRRRPT